MKQKVLVIVAHPDDELIWMGGLLLRHKKDWDTTVVCMTRESDQDRAPKFARVQKALGTKGIIHDLDDEHLHKPLEEKHILEKLKPFKGKHFDMIYTHGKAGEYGHPRHIEIHKAILKALKERTLSSTKTLFFSYHKIENDYQGYALYNSNADKLIKLTRDEVHVKKHLITDVYGYTKDGFEEKSCGEMEGFDELK